MKVLRRTIVTTVLGFLAGFFCYWISKGKVSYTPEIMWSVVLNRALLGFILGISVLKWNYIFHGMIIGAIASIPLAVPAFFNSPTGGWIILIAGAFYGLIIELITSGLLRLKR